MSKIIFIECTLELGSHGRMYIEEIWNLNVVQVIRRRHQFGWLIPRLRKMVWDYDFKRTGLRQTETKVVTFSKPSTWAKFGNSQLSTVWFKTGKQEKVFVGQWMCGGSSVHVLQNHLDFRFSFAKMGNPIKIEF